MKQFICALCGLLCTAGMVLPAAAAELDCGERYCFSAEDFAPGDMPLTGICITRLPAVSFGSVMLGSRYVCPGDVLTAEQAAEMTFVPAHSESDSSASISYLPVFANGISGESTMTFSIRRRENKPPVAEDSAYETYKNLEMTGRLRVHDPEEQALQFTVTREPKRGTLSIQEDGSFTYTPKKNKVGIDSFTFTAADPSGKVSREATVTVTILKPTDAKQYSDTTGKSCRFAAEWMKNTGIFIGESVGGNPCFSPDRAVTRGEFLTMLVKTLKLTTDAAVTETGYQDAPDWLKPYLAAAVRSGLIAALPAQDTFCPDAPVTGDDAASLLCAALKLRMEQQPAIAAESAANAMAIAAENGFALKDGQILTRADTAELLYHVIQLQEQNAQARF